MRVAMACIIRSATNSEQRDTLVDMRGYKMHLREATMYVPSANGQSNPIADAEAAPRPPRQIHLSEPISSLTHNNPPSGQDLHITIIADNFPPSTTTRAKTQPPSIEITLNTQPLPRPRLIPIRTAPPILSLEDRQTTSPLPDISE